MEKEVVWIDGRDPRLGLCGCAGGEAYCRFSAEEREALKKVNPDEAYLSTNPAGVMLRFFTDSSIVAVRGKSGASVRYDAYARVGTERL